MYTSCKTEKYPRREKKIPLSKKLGRFKILQSSIEVETR